jgi:8-oxo-dGTP diphosphatase
MDFVEVAVGAWLRDGKIFLGQRRNEGSQALRWELPGGTRENNESFEEALIREWKEELNLEVVAGELLGSHTVPAGKREARIVVFKLEVHDESLMENNYHLDTGWFNRFSVDQLDVASGSLPFIKKLLRAEPVGV